MSSFFAAGTLPLVEALTLGVLAGEPGRYGPIQLWGLSLPHSGARAHAAASSWRASDPILRLLACGFCMAGAYGTLDAFFDDRSAVDTRVLAEIVVFSLYHPRGELRLRGGPLRHSRLRGGRPVAAHRRAAEGALWQAGGEAAAFSSSAPVGLAGLLLAQGLKRAGL